MENKRRALGKGLEQLFGSENVDLDAFEQNIVDTASNNDEIKQIKLSEIRSNPYQPRTYYIHPLQADQHIADKYLLL